MTEPVSKMKSMSPSVSKMAAAPAPAAESAGGVAIDDTTVSRTTAWSSEETQERIAESVDAIPPGLRLIEEYEVTTSGTYAKNPRGVLFDFEAIGGGPGGGSGSVGDATANRSGGGGGSGGTVALEKLIHTRRLADTWPITIGAAGLGGNSVTSATSVNGNPGTAGGDTIAALASGFYLRAPGGAPGSGGSPSGGSGGSIRSIGNQAQFQNSGGGTSPANGTSGGANSIGSHGPGGGAGGAGLTTTNTGTVGNNGGASFKGQRGNWGTAVGSAGVVTAAAGGNNIGSNGADAPPADPGQFGHGGGGGGSNPATDGGRGGHGSAPGGAGAGGGAARSGRNSGAGGNGAPGAFRVRVYGYVTADEPITALADVDEKPEAVEIGRYQVVENATAHKVNVICWDGQSHLGSLYDGYTVEPDDGSPIWSPPEPTPQEKLAAFLSENQDVLALISPS